jgi:hypothetical protein
VPQANCPPITATHELPFHDDAINLEHFPKLSGPHPQQKILSKSLVYIAVGNKAKENIRKLMRLFPTEHFSYVFSVYDKSDWSEEPYFSDVTWIYTTKQMRLWALKRFLLPAVTSAYEYVWCIDEDAEIHFDPLEYIEKCREYSVDFSMPSNLNRGVNWPVTHKSDENTLLRWVDFVECGPLWVASAKAWPYVWDSISPEVVSGYGIDLRWCPYYDSHIPDFSGCAIWDGFGMNHLNTHSASEGPGGNSYDPNAETAVYSSRLGAYYSQYGGSSGYYSDRILYKDSWRPKVIND